MGRIVNLGGEVAAEAEEGGEGLVLPAEAWDRLRASWSDEEIDDALALLYAVASPEIDLRAVSCTSGNVEARQVAENTRALLELVGRDDVEAARGYLARIAGKTA